MSVPALVAALLLTVLAGCAGEAPADETELGTLDVTDTTGGIRGVVFDTTVTPVEGAAVALNSGQQTTTDAGGVFTFTGLEPGTYFVTVERFGYESVQTSVQVVAGVEAPP